MDRFVEMATFIRVVRSGSITAAAEQQSIAKSAVSKRLRDLEKRLGVQLLTRTTRRLTLTSAGGEFLERAEAILADVEEAESEAQSARGRLSGRVRVAAPLTFGLMHLSPVIRAFSRANPEVKLDLDLSDRQVDLIEDGFDLAIRIATLADSNLAARPLTSSRHAVVASPGYFAGQPIPQTPEELGSYQCLEYTNRADPSWHYVTPDGKQGSVRLSHHLRANNGEFLRDAAIAGLGIVLQPTFIIYKALESGQLMRLLPDYDWHEVTAYAVYPQTRYLPARVRAFIDYLADYFDRETAYWDMEVAAPQPLKETR
ncbi:MAG: LysR family transcriptional regulator [Gammaproteobacteria bacterium]|nr:MAG: LysR family transcriptional regulator [Gammaproteobacteria bacterium]